MPHRCIAGGCSNTRKDGVSLHKWPEDAHFAKLWMNAVKNTRSDVFNPLTSRLCSAHFTEDSFEEQSVIAKSLGLKMKNILKPNTVPTVFKNGPPQTKKLKQHDKTYLKKLAPDHQNTRRSRHEELIENEKPLGYVKEEIKAYCLSM